MAPRPKRAAGGVRPIRAPAGRAVPSDGAEHEAPAGTLAHFLVERSALIARTRAGRLFRWTQARARRRIRSCEVTLARNTLGASAGLPALAGRPAARCAARSLVRMWLPERVAGTLAR